MTGEPGYTFRETDENPHCSNCDKEMTLKETVDGVHNERDVYVCDNCGADYEDRWTY